MSTDNPHRPGRNQPAWRLILWTPSVRWWAWGSLLRQEILARGLQQTLALEQTLDLTKTLDLEQTPDLARWEELEPRLELDLTRGAGFEPRSEALDLLLVPLDPALEAAPELWAALRSSRARVQAGQLRIVLLRTHAPEPTGPATWHHLPELAWMLEHPGLPRSGQTLGLDAGANEAAQAISLLLDDLLELLGSDGSVELPAQPAPPLKAAPKEWDDAAGPVLAGPVLAEPVVAGPVVAGPVLAEPVLAEPVVAGPVVAEPVLAGPVVAGPVVAGPVVAGPVLAEPVLAGPVVAGPVVAGPVLASPEGDDGGSEAEELEWEITGEHSPPEWVEAPLPLPHPGAAGLPPGTGTGARPELGLPRPTGQPPLNPSAAEEPIATAGPVGRSRGLRGLSGALSEVLESVGEAVSWMGDRLGAALGRQSPLSPGSDPSRPPESPKLARPAPEFRPPDPAASEPPETSSGGEEGATPPPRTVNLWLEQADHRPLPEKSLLSLGDLLLLRLGIGSLSDSSRVENPEPLSNRVMAQVAAAGGAWLAVGFYSPDFVLTPGREGGDPPSPVSDKGLEHGAAAQRSNQAGEWYRHRGSIWLPAQGESEVLELPIRPVRRGLCALRVCIYHRNQLLQSLLLEARVGEAQEAQDTLWHRGHRVRVEFSLSDDLSDLGRFQPRALNLFVNDLAGRPALGIWAGGEGPRVSSSPLGDGPLGNDSVGNGPLGNDSVGDGPLGDGPLGDGPLGNDSVGNGPLGGGLNGAGRGDGRTSGLLSARFLDPEALSRALVRVRGELEAVGEVALTGGRTAYRFDPETQAGQDEDLEVLVSLAREGAELYSFLFGVEVRGQLSFRLDAPDQVIQVARVAESQVVPWSLIYSLDLDTTPGVELTLCRRFLEPVSPEGAGDAAALPDCGACASRPDCPQKGDDAAEQVCPWGFWGFKHRIEQPAQRVVPGAGPGGLHTELGDGGGLRVWAALGAGLQQVDRHRGKLEQLPNVRELRLVGGGVSGRTGDQGPRAQALERLRQPGLDLIYFYCHGGRDGSLANVRPVLHVGATGEAAVVPSELGRLKRGHPLYRFLDHPLVIINGCETAELEPHLLSQFIEAFAQAGAAGVIGTETRVWEPLARHIGEELLGMLLRHIPLGECLQELRLELLRRKNPLGLTYTLYCSAELRLRAASS